MTGNNNATTQTTSHPATTHTTTQQSDSNTATIVGVIIAALFIFAFLWISFLIMNEHLERNRRRRRAQTRYLREHGPPPDIEHTELDLVSITQESNSNQNEEPTPDNTDLLLIHQHLNPNRHQKNPGFRLHGVFDR